MLLNMKAVRDFDRFRCQKQKNNDHTLCVIYHVECVISSCHLIIILLGDQGTTEGAVITEFTTRKGETLSPFFI